MPLTAIAPGDDDAHGYVFVFDPAEKVVRKVAIRGGEGVRGNYVEVVEGDRCR